MHGRPRKALKPEDEAASAAKTQKLRALQTQFFSFHHNKIYTKEAVELSAKLLESNPESYTAWNYRKLAVEHYLSLPDCNPDSVKSVLDDELRVVENALRQNFKSYGAWHHRKWVLSKGHSSINNELRLLDKFQKADSRNFHAWNYRRFVAESMKRSEQDELKYTEDMIYTNFSNYSAWHNRSALLSALFEKKAEGFLLKEKVLPEEYEFIHQAIFTDPDDQSGWFYHLWLLDQTVTTDSPLLASSWPGHGSDVLLVGDRWYNGSAFSPFTALHSDSGSFPIVLYFNQPVGGVSSSTVTVECGFNKNEDLLWKPLSASNSQTAGVWVAHLKVPSSDLHSTVEVSVGHSKGIISTRGFEYSHPSMFSFEVHVQPKERDSSQVSVAESISLREENFKVYGTQSEESIIDSFDQPSIKNVHETTTSNWRSEALAKEIECFRELLSLVDCKIGKLTLARLLKAYDAMSYPFANKLMHSEEVLELYSDLMKLDPKHYQYYKDEHSMVLLQKVTSSKESLLQHCFQYKDSVSSAICGPICLRLNNLPLSRMGAFEKLLWVQMLDLSHNELQSIEGLEAMQLLSCLSLRNNKLRSLTALEPLRKLKFLRVLDISYNQIGDHSIDTTRYLCSSPLSHSVGSESSRDETVTSDVALINNWEAFYIFKDFNLSQLDIVGNTIADEKFKSVLVKIMPKLKQLDGKLLN